ncbi:SusC/RagA family TonB-linked outer membrane protein [Mucilaginibacter pocheonensis]|uniref:TonB-linked SusC/RagA family outer membrane protein n=1 Tax=Mucilaginibacter pocheonensis TaxID=398050 RepID=A0ABU1TC49_9SPHI|nr:TonB-dependent receptor [Mucilaginibacter pocheonensis]MDR6942969.1 TonB-linked SusC/RagA family outer membrane protein [Mucilaginibacter pocheonensis]
MQKKLYYAIIKKKHFYLFLFALLFGNMAFGQQAGRIRGKVTDERDEPLPGVAVLVKGTQNGVSTNNSGEYSINATPSSVLVFKMIGFETVETVVGNRGEINIKLKMAARGLDEVTVSYGKQRSREVTGSIAQISATPLQDMPVGQFAQQLQGKVAGVDISQTSGQPGRGMAFRIRGAASLTLDYQPLFVIDGLPVTGSINNINPDEIETFTILKDASSTALYGSRAANGVILITTKHAKAGDSKIQFSSNYGVQKIPMNRVPDMMNANQFATFMNERYQDQVKYEPGTNPKLDPAYADPSQYGEGTDWFKLLTRTAPIQSYDLTVQTAREKSTSTVMAGYQSQQGVIINTGTRLFSLRINQDLTLSNNKLKIGFNLAPSYRLDHNNRLNTDGVGGLFERVFESSPLISPYNPDGTYTKNVNSPGMVSYINPLAQFMLNKDDYITTRILGNAYLNYEFLPGLSIKVNAGADKGAETRNQFTPASITANSIATGLSSSVDNYSWTAETNVQYNKTIANDHNIEALVGYSAQKFSQVSNSVSGTGYPNDDIPYLSAATSITAGSSNITEYSLLSAIGRLNYNYKGKYLLQGAVRRDGSSRFGTNRKYGYFPSVSAGWIVSDETFMENIKIIDFLKIRSSYGITGNNTIGNYTALSALGKYNYVLNGVSVAGQTIGTLGNPELAWERNKQFDVGLDLSILKSRISITYDYYHKLSDGLIQSRPIPRASGFSSINFNIGQFAFWGHEIGVNTVNLTGKLKWNSSFNVSFERNIIKSLVSPGFIRRNNTVSSDYYRNQVGHHLGEFYGFVYEGLYKDATDLANSAKYGSSSDVGTIKVKDINGDGVIDDVNDRTFIGDPTPDFNFGITNTFTYKNFDLNISMAGAVGGQILNAAKWAYQTNMDGSRMLLAAALDHWRSPEDPGSGIYPRTKTGTTAMGRQVNSQWLESGSYLTAKNISLGYNFKLKNGGMLKNLRVYGSVQQAFIITGYTGMNPEISFSGLDATQGIGVDENAYPVPRTFSFGIQTTFK